MPHPHDLARAYYSIHTDAEAVVKGGRATTPRSPSRPMKGGESSGACSAAAATHTHDTIERHRIRDTLEFVCALVLNDEEPGYLPLDCRGDQNGSEFGRSLNSRGNVGCFPEHLEPRHGVRCLIEIGIEDIAKVFHVELRGGWSNPPDRRTSL